MVGMVGVGRYLTANLVFFFHFTIVIILLSKILLKSSIRFLLLLLFRVVRLNGYYKMKYIHIMMGSPNKLQHALNIRDEKLGKSMHALLKHDHDWFKKYKKNLGKH